MDSLSQGSSAASDFDELRDDGGGIADRNTMLKEFINF
jgi:hypothetical protein